MPNRDYAKRSQSKKGVNKLLVLIIVLLLILLSALGLWTLQDKAPPPKPVEVKPVVQHKNELPSKPEEIYSYIRDLETREVPVNKDAKLAHLTKEQERAILQKQKAEKQRLDEQKLEEQKLEQQAVQFNQEQTAQTSTTVIGRESEPEIEAVITPVTPPVVAKPALTEQQLAEKKAKEKKLAEERKQAELKKRELAKKAEQERLKEVKETATAKETKEHKKPVKIVAVAKSAAEAPKSVGKYGLQCGAFKSKAQAENMQARLAMAGYNARISSSADWNRVIVGPIGDRAAASTAQSNARSVAECLIVGM